MLVGWGVGGAVAEALAARSAVRPRRVVALDALAPGVRDEEPAEPELLRSFAMYCGARRGRPLAVDPERLHAGLEPALAHILEAAVAAGALRAGHVAGDVPPLLRRPRPPRAPRPPPRPPATRPPATR